MSEYLPGQNPSPRAQSAERRHVPIRSVHDPRTLRKGEIGEYGGNLYWGLGGGQYKAIGAGGVITQPSPSPAPTTFLSLTDTPNSYAGQAERFVRVNSVPDALAFGSIVDDDIPESIMRDNEHQADPHTMTIDGVDVSEHNHSGAGQGGTVSHNSLSNVTSDQHHARAHSLHDAADHSNVQVSGLSDGQVLVWDAATSKWVNEAQSGGGGTDEKVKVSSDDTTAGYVEDKLAAGSGITLATLNPGGNEQRQIALADHPHGSGAVGGALGTGVVGTTQLADSAVTVAKLASYSVRVAKLAFGSICAPIYQGRNLIADGAFETDQDGDGLPDLWYLQTVTGITYTLSAGQGTVGYYALCITRRETASGTADVIPFARNTQLSRNNQQWFIPVNPSEAYVVRFYAKRSHNDALGALTVYLENYSYTGTWLAATTAIATVSPGTTWTEYTGTVAANTMNASTRYVRILIRDSSTPSGDGNGSRANYIDGVQFILNE